MRITQEFFTFFCASTFMKFTCKADPLPAPRELSYKWIDPFTLNMSWSWERPDYLPQDCEIQYQLQSSNKDLVRGKYEYQYLNVSFLTEEMHSGHRRYSIQAVGTKSCDGWESIAESITVKTTKPRTEVVRDFKCLIESAEMNCSWIPVNSYLEEKVFYRYCGNSKEDVRSLKRCDRHYSSKERNGCYLKADLWPNRAVCVLVETDAGLETFKPAFAISTKMSITEDGDDLRLTWKRPHVGENCGWIYEVNYKECNEQQKKMSFNQTREAKKHGPLPVPYRKHCRYEFHFTVKTDDKCISLQGEGSGTYGTNRLPSRTIWVVTAAVTSMILSFCFVLTCYCFRRHSAIFCPIIPDPSAIFKEMMMNGSKELKTTTESLYIPVQEPIEPCKITLITENAGSQKSL